MCYDKIFLHPTMHQVTRLSEYIILKYFLPQQPKSQYILPPHPMEVIKLSSEFLFYRMLSMLSFENMY